MKCKRNKIIYPVLLRLLHRYTHLFKRIKATLVAFKLIFLITRQLWGKSVINHNQHINFNFNPIIWLIKTFIPVTEIELIRIHMNPKVKRRARKRKPLARLLNNSCNRNNIHDWLISSHIVISIYLCQMLHK